MEDQRPPESNDPLIIGKEYDLWRDGQYIGQANFWDDQNIGECFIAKTLSPEGEVQNLVFIADKWKLSK